MIRAVLFDFDGTLANTLPFYVKAYDQALQKLGFKWDERKIVQNCFGKKEIDICKALGLPEKTQEFTNSYFSAVKELFKQAQLFSDTLETLEFIKNKGLKIVIITFAYRWYIDQMIKQYNLDNYLDLVISTDDVDKAKPDPEAVLEAVKILKIKPDAVLVVGDSKSDILMGNSAGSKTVLFFIKEYELFYNFKEIKKASPTFIINNLTKLKEIINKKYQIYE
ncbi:hypothetical protein A2963_03600 [Candidatus Roizmanbacteria bacterium RIFCSPLOWO2_01_FULL_40_13]|nr:MAG: hypothetical protein A2963_03600 [Candidatus Roizmanbacteria bacterium RIFCSPLOWO2_01_FULL_40_13]